MSDFKEVTQPLAGSIDDAIRRLVSVEHFRAGSMVAMPVRYPSGSTVVLEIVAQKDKFLISDRGGGAQDAEFSGASRYYKSEALRVASATGVRFDGLTMFIAEAPQQVLRGAMIAVANCSAEAATAALLRLSERSDNDARDELYIRLTSIYATMDVQKDAEFRGARAKWRVSVAVLGGAGPPGFFEPVTGRYISAVGTTAKFNDFAATEDPPARFGVIKSPADLGDYYSLVASAATKLVPVTAPNSTFVELLEAA